MEASLLYTTIRRERENDGVCPQDDLPTVQATPSHVFAIPVRQGHMIVIAAVILF